MSHVLAHIQRCAHALCYACCGSPSRSPPPLPAGAPPLPRPRLPPPPPPGIWGCRIRRAGRQRRWGWRGWQGRERRCRAGSRSAAPRALQGRRGANGQAGQALRDWAHRRAARGRRGCKPGCCRPEGAHVRAKVAVALHSRRPCSCPGEGTAPRSDWRASQWACPTPTQHATPPKTPRPPRTSHGVPSGQVARRGRHLGAGAGQRGEAGIQRVHLLLQPLIVTPGAVQLDLQGQAERAQQRVSARGTGCATHPTWTARAFLLLRHPSARCCSITICCCCSHAAAPPLGLA